MNPAEQHGIWGVEPPAPAVDKVDISLVFSGDSTGMLTGQGGSALHAIESESGAEVSLQEVVSLKEDTIFILGVSGSPERVQAAQKRLLDKLAILEKLNAMRLTVERSLLSPSEAVTERIPVEMTALVESSIPALTRKTGASLRVVPGNVINTGMAGKMVYIAGEPTQIMLARQALAELVKPGENEQRFNLTMAVPNVLANHIIGKEETIERVLSIPGVQMEVEQSEASPMLREDASYVMLSGTQGKMMAAQAMIVHTIAKTVDLKELVHNNIVAISTEQSPADPVDRLRINMQISDEPLLAPQEVQGLNYGGGACWPQLAKWKAMHRARLLGERHHQRELQPKPKCLPDYTPPGDSEEGVSRRLNPAEVYSLSGTNEEASMSALCSCRQGMGFMDVTPVWGQAWPTMGIILRPAQPALAAGIQETLQSTMAGRAVAATRVLDGSRRGRGYLATITCTNERELNPERMREAFAHVDDNAKPDSTWPFFRGGRVVGYVGRFTGDEARYRFNRFLHSVRLLNISFTHEDDEHGGEGRANQHARIEVRDVNYGDG